MGVPGSESSVLGGAAGQSGAGSGFYDYQIENSDVIGLKMCIRELQEEVAKMKNEPVGILFTWLK